ncbi:MAG: hypothetical protein II336_08570 [Loktanella sp.]|nr:hypothetical protein [Loktanella sp.]
MITRFILAAALSAVLSPAARADTVLAICQSGGCECSLSPLSAQEIMFMVGETFGSDTPVDPTRDTLVYEPDLGIVSWGDGSRSDIQRHFGGTGDCPIKLFPEPEAMVPLDGTWQWRTLGESTSGCPAALGGMLAASRVEFMSTRVDWNGAFHPGRLAAGFPQPDMPGVSPYEWRETGPYRWLSDNVQSRECSDGTCAEIALGLNMTLVAPDRISGLLSLRSSIDGPQAAILAGFGMADCRVRVRYDIVHTGP